MTLSILILSWDRPRALELTMSSVIHSLRNSKIEKEIIILDQNSGFKAKEIIAKWKSQFDRTILLNENIGITQGWNELFNNSKGKYILPLENDWFCDAESDYWLVSAIEILESNKKIGFVKLRKVNDKDDYGHQKLEHSPWTLGVKGKPYFTLLRLPNGAYYFTASPKNIGFTYNPILMSRTFREYIHDSFNDNLDDITPLRSGENEVDKFWRSQKEYFGATLKFGPFKHIGFHNLHDKLIIMPIYISKHFVRLARNYIIRKVVF